MGWRYRRGVALRQALGAWVGRGAVLGLTAGEWLPAVALAVWGAVEPANEGSVRGPTAVVAGASVVAALLLAWRRRHPVAVLALATAVLVLPAALWGASELGSAAAVVAVGVYACGRYGRRPAAYAGPVIGAVAVTLQLALDPQESADVSWVWALNTVWIFVLGVWVRQQRTLVERAAAVSEARAAAAAAEERLRTAREVHDILAHNLAVMLVQADAADELLDSDPARARRALQQVHQTGRGAMEDVRRFLRGMRGPEESGSDGTGSADLVGVAAIPDLVHSVGNAGLPVSLAVSGDLTRVGDESGAVAYRVVQESLTNVLRHAGTVPTRVDITLSGAGLRVRVDNGAARDRKPAGDRAESAGHGLRGMRERVAALGGTLHAAPTPDGGFRVDVRLPWTAVPSQASV